AEIPVDDGSVITVVCGDESWPTMNDNSSEKQTYTITVSFPSPWQRINGTDRYETMSKIVEESFDSCDTAVVASGENFPDALSASALAGQLDCPVVITETSTLSDSAKSTLESLGVSNVVIVGGKAAVSESAESAIEDMGITASRVSGKTRQDTSLAVMDEVLNSSQPDTVIVATGKNFADALSIAPLAYAKGFPVVLTENDGTLTSAEVEAIQETGAENAIIVGGSAAVSSSVDSQLSDMTVTRINGKDRYATSSEIANYEVENCGMDYSKVAIASGENFPDALTGAAMCGYNNSVLILANDTTDSGITEVVNNGSSISTGYVLGGSAAVSEDVFDYLDTNAK
ncbi:MAG: cell wall-binding repeat-containing protein, partial [Coriobacteriales bacterium]